jgi:hypothetical protein
MGCLASTDDGFAGLIPVAVLNQNWTDFRFLNPNQMELAKATADYVCVDHESVFPRATSTPSVLLVPCCMYDHSDRASLLEPTPFSMHTIALRLLCGCWRADGAR